MPTLKSIDRPNSAAGGHSIAMTYRILQYVRTYGIWPYDTVECNRHDVIYG